MDLAAQLGRPAVADCGDSKGTRMTTLVPIRTLSMVKRASSSRMSSMVGKVKSESVYTENIIEYVLLSENIWNIACDTCI